MKKTMLVCVICLLFLTKKSLGQPYTFTSKSPVNTEANSYNTFFDYTFDRSYMVIRNEYAIDPSIKNTDLFIHYPYPSRKIQVYGPWLFFTISANGNPPNFVDPAKVASAGTMVWDTIFKDIIEARIKKQEPTFQKPSKFEMDSIVKKEKKFDLATLQTRIIKNHKLVQDWKNVSQLGAITLATDVAKGNFVVYNDYLKINDRVEITFRNNTDTTLIRFEFERMDSPLLPFLATFHRDTTSIAYADFVKKVWEKKLASKFDSDDFYRYWPAYRNAAIKNERIYSDTKLALTFRKPDPSYVDTTMEYILAAGSIDDSLWQTTGHMLFLSDFKPGTDYSLLIRYKSTPGNIITYRFHTLPKWYQTTTYKFILSGIVIFLLLAVFVLFSRMRLKKEKKKTAYLQYGLKSIRSQLNPHFIFNALSSIQGLINKNDISGANHYLTEFSSLLRESLRNNDKELVPLDAELRILETYLKLEQLRFHFQFEIKVDDSIDKNGSEIPALLLQPLIENAIKHGVAGLQENGKISITFRAYNQDLIVSISDNGKGFMQNIATEGFGLKLTKDRIALLNQSFKKQPIQLSIESAQNKGTTVLLAFENWL